MRDSARSLVHQVRLREFLARRLRPLIVLLSLTIAISAPVAFYAFGAQAARVQAEAVARRVAETIRRDAEERPWLWKYDSPKLVQHLRTYEELDAIERIDVVDSMGIPIEPVLPEDRRALQRASVLWGDAPVQTSAGEVGRVWVAATTAPVRNGALLLVVPFTILALTLAGFVYWLPLRAMSRADDRIGALIGRLEESQGALSDLADGLDAQVQQRSSELAQAYDEVRVKEKRLRDLSGRAVNMQESERRAIARELHDSAGQALTAIRINLQVISQTGESSPVGELAQRTMEMVDGTLEEIRRAVRTLGPAVLDDIGLQTALERLCDNMSEGQSYSVTLRASLGTQPLPAAVESTVYRVVQEALTNAARHAQAHSVGVTVEVRAEMTRLEIVDDGRGFDPEHPTRSRGLLGMRERVELLGGHLEVQSRPGHGTRIVVELPPGPF